MKNYPILTARTNFPSISNLNAAVAPFIAQKCAVHVDNFFYVNLGTATHPIYLRKPELAVTNRSDKKNLGFAWVLDEEIRENLTLSPDVYETIQKEFKKITLYNLFPTENDVHYFFPVLLPTNFFHLSAHSKPWSCHVHMLLFPPFKLYSHLKLPPPVWYPFASGQMIHQLPSSVPKITFFVLDPVLQHDIIEEELFLNSNIPPADATYNHIFLAANVTYATPNSFEMRWNSSSAVIDRVEIVQICSVCINNSIVETGGLFNMQRVDADALKSLQKLQSLAFTDYNSGVHLETDISQGFRGTRTVEFFFAECKIEAAPFIATSPSLLSLPERRSQAQAHVWLSILKNCSISVFLINCYNGKKIISHSKYKIQVSLLRNVLISSYGHTGTQFPVRLTNKLDSIQFVSCGKRGYQSLPYRQITKVFDKYVWIYLIIIGAVVLPLLSRIFSGLTPSIGDGLTFTDRLLLGWKIFLEQGDKDLLRFQPLGLKLGVGGIILTGVVLSNAYKNCQVYSMISHREPIPYETLEELIRDEFTVVSRITDIDVKFVYYHYYFVDGFGRGLELNTFPHEIHDSKMRVVSAYSEVQELMFSKEGPTSSTKKLHANSRILSGLGQWLKELIQELLIAQQASGKINGIKFEIFINFLFVCVLLLNNDV